MVAHGEVLRVDAHRTLELTRADDDWDESTRVIFRLEEAPTGTTCLPRNGSSVR